MTLIKKQSKWIAAILLIATLLTLFLAGCKKDTGNTSMTIALESNPTTGYSWEAETSGSGKLTLESSEVFRESDSELSGAPSIQQFVFTPETSGDVKVAFVYQQGWDGGEQAYSVVYELEVQKDLSIQFVNKTVTPLGNTLMEDIPAMPDPVITE